MCEGKGVKLKFYALNLVFFFFLNISINEQMVRYCGHYFKNFIRAKPIQIGFEQ